MHKIHPFTNICSPIRTHPHKHTHLHVVYIATGYLNPSIIGLDTTVLCAVCRRRQTWVAIPGDRGAQNPLPLRVGYTVYSCPLQISKKLQKRSKHFLTRENSFHLFLTRSIQKWPVYLQLSNKIAASGGNNYRRPYKVYQRRLA